MATPDPQLDGIHEELKAIRQLLLLLVVGLGALVAAGLVLTVIASLTS